MRHSTKTVKPTADQGDSNHQQLDSQLSSARSKSSSSRRPSLLSKPRHSSGLRNESLAKPPENYGSSQSTSPSNAPSSPNMPWNPKPPNHLRSGGPLKLVDSPAYPSQEHDNDPPRTLWRQAVESSPDERSTNISTNPTPPNRKSRPSSSQVPSISKTSFSSLAEAVTSPTSPDPSTATSTESNKTIRGPTPDVGNESAATTPAYPFPPTQSGPTKSHPTPLHQPFTTLSPTVSPMTRCPGPENPAKARSLRQSSHPPPSSSVVSEASAPVSNSSPDVSKWLSSNLYDLILELNSEPELDPWWRNLCAILREQYQVERACLAVPADATDIENVPWAQKASFDAKGLKCRMVQKPTLESMKPPEDSTKSAHISASNLEQTSSHGRNLGAMNRPAMQSRHSYAGYEARTHSSRTSLSQNTRRLATDQRNSQQIFTTEKFANFRDGNPYPPHDNPQPSSKHVLHDSEEALSQQIAENQSHAIFPTLRMLDAERQALLDSGSVNRILERKAPVTLTREHPSLRRDSSPWGLEVSSSDSSSPSTSPQTEKQQSKGSKDNNKYKRNALDQPFEEHEQIPASPWAQSPAPSPAVQADPDENPFFVGQGQVEESSFSPTSNPEDYSGFGQVEAIGVDKATSTVIHIPLIHPLLSRDVNTSPTSPNRRISNSVSQGEHTRHRVKQSFSTRITGKAPIAILSLLSSQVPYPQSFIDSLVFASPHIATSYNVAMQLENARLLPAKITGLSEPHSAAKAAIKEGLGLRGYLPVDTAYSSSSVTASTASPSDYSGRSKHSPEGSRAPTPTQDPTSPGPNIREKRLGSFSSEAGYEVSEVRKRASYVRSTSNGVVPQSLEKVMAQGSRPDSPASGHRPSSSHGYKDVLSRTSEHSGYRRPDNALPLSSGSEALEGRVVDPLAQVIPASRERTTADTEGDHPTSKSTKRHTLLHSLGADFTASFQSLPAASTTSEKNEMPPPSDNLLRTIIDALPCQIFTAHPRDGKVTWVNSKYLVYRGDSPRDILDNPWNTIHERDLGSYLQSWNLSLSNGHQFQQKVRLRRFDGQYRWFFVRAVPLRDKNQNIVHWIGTYVDFHEQHVAEVNAAKQHETAASEAKYRALANSSPQIVFSATREKGITFCNNQWQSYSGQSAEQALCLGFMDFVHPDDVVKCKLPEFDEDETEAINVPVSLPARPRRIQSSASSGNDYSEDSTDTSVTFTGVAAASPVELPQRKLSELAGKGILKVAKDKKGQPSYSTEVRLRNRSGDYRWHLVRVLLADSLIQSENGEEIWYGSCSDINDHKALEGELKETMDAKSRFLSNMSHEIRTPLNGIHGMTSFLIETKLTEEQMDHVNVIRASTDGLRDLINDILDLSKVEAGMISLNMDWLSIQSVVEEVNDMLSTLASEKGLELNYVLADDIPLTVKGDRFRIKQVLLNTIGNAIKFTKQGEVLVRCKVVEEPEVSKASRTDQGPEELPVLVEFSVQDTGKGFSDKEAERLFKRFSQIDGSSTRHHGGSGLGLVISMQLVELHGGHMTANSVPEKGSTFSFSLQLTAPQVIDRDATQKPLSQSPMIAKDAVRGGTPSGSARPFASPQSILAGDLSESPLPEQPSSKSSVSLSSVRDSSPSSQATRRSIVSDQYSSKSSSKSSVDSGNVPDVRKNIHLGVQRPMLFSVLVVSPLLWALEAATAHVKVALPQNVPHQVSSCSGLEEAHRITGGEEPLTFSHVVMITQDSAETLDFTRQLISNPIHSKTTVVFVTTSAMKREIFSNDANEDCRQLAEKEHLRVIFKPLKPAKLAPLFDSGLSRESSIDQNQQSAQQIAENQKKVFDGAMGRLEDKHNNVLLVEDNLVNQKVLLRFLKRIGIDAEVALDGVQCTDKVYSNGLGYYSIILCDLHMPNKDGYQTCREIRQWENTNNHHALPIVALSANVLGDVYDDCVKAGFNAFLTKPVDFKRLSEIMLKYLDPKDPSTRVEFLKSHAKPQ